MEIDVRNKLYEKCHRKFRKRLPGVSVPLKSRCLKGGVGHFQHLL